MYTLGTTPKTVCKIAETHSVNIGVVAKAILQRGAIVKLDADGEVSAVADATSKPFGMVVAGNRGIGEEVTIQTEFNALLRCKASGPVVLGDAVSAISVAEDATGLTSVAKSVATNYVIGMALSDAADGEDVQVGIYRVSTLLS